MACQLTNIWLRIHAGAGLHEIIRNGGFDNHGLFGGADFEKSNAI
ncbi:hypothetical protein ACQUJT_02470 [Ralstonia pseudosolanacearum]